MSIYDHQNWVKRSCRLPFAGAMGPRKRKAFDRDEADEADEAETADEGFMHPARVSMLLFSVFLKGLQTIIDHNGS